MRGMTQVAPSLWNLARAGRSRISEPGHDARKIGDEPAVGFAFEPTAAETYTNG